MTYWSEIEHGADHARRALASIAAIRGGGGDGETRSMRAEGLPRISVRFGLHCGDALVGEIGESRLTHTVIGDVVNVADRLQKAAKGLPDRAGDDGVKGYVSAAVHAAAIR